MISLANITRLTALLVVAFLLSVGIYYAMLPTDQNYFKYDAWGYYIYLPSFFIYHDALQISHAADAIWKYDLSHYFYQASKLPNGNYVFGYTGGVALLQLPFFLAAHFTALCLGFVADGYSAVYRTAVLFSGIFYGLSGLVFCYRFLRFYFDSKIAILACLILLFATNLFNYLFFQNGMGHVYSFFLFSTAMLFTKRFYDSAKLQDVLIVGLASGLVFLIRPTNILFLIPLFFIGTKNIIPRLQFMWQNRWKIILASLLAICPFCLQMIYWKWATGTFFFNPYSNLGLGFDFLHPHIYFGLFSYEKGWLFYSPIFVLALVAWLFKKDFPPVSKWILGLYFLLNIYIIYSWKVYNYGGGFGARPMVDSYALWAIPLAVSLEFLRSKKILKIPVVLFVVCVANNLFQTYKYQKDYLSSSGYSKYEIPKSYFNYSGYQLSSDTKNKINRNAFIAERTHSLSIEDSSILLINEGNMYSPSLVFDSLPNFPNKYFLRAEAMGKYHSFNILRGKHRALLVFQQTHNGQIYFWAGKPIAAQTIQGDSTLQSVLFEKELVLPFNAQDVFSCYLYNPSANSFQLTSLKLYLMKKR